MMVDEEIDLGVGNLPDLYSSPQRDDVPATRTYTRPGPHQQTATIAPTPSRLRDSPRRLKLLSTGPDPRLLRRPEARMDTKDSKLLERPLAFPDAVESSLDGYGSLSSHHLPDSQEFTPRRKAPVHHKINSGSVSEESSPVQQQEIIDLQLHQEEEQARLDSDNEVSRSHIGIVRISHGERRNLTDEYIKLLDDEEVGDTNAGGDGSTRTGQDIYAAEGGSLDERTRFHDYFVGSNAIHKAVQAVNPTSTSNSNNARPGQTRTAVMSTDSIAPRPVQIRVGKVEITNQDSESDGPMNKGGPQNQQKRKSTQSPKSPIKRPRLDHEQTMSLSPSSINSPSQVGSTYSGSQREAESEDDQSEDDQSQEDLQDIAVSAEACTADNEDGTREDDDDDDETGVEADLVQAEHTLFGKSKSLQRVYSYLSVFGRPKIDGKRMARGKLELDDETVKPVVQLCQTIKQNLASPGDSLSLSELLDGVLPDMEARTVSLHVPTHDRVRKTETKDSKNNSRCEQIYYHLLPELVRTLQTAIVRYEAEQAENGHVKISANNSLRSLLRLMDLIIKLRENMIGYGHPDGISNLVQPAISMCAELKGIAKRWQRVIDDDEEKRRRVEAEREQGLRQLAASQLAQELKRQDGLKQSRYKKWAGLHAERLWAEGGLISRTKRERLQMPKHLPETDATGTPFERVEMFAARIGPPLASVVFARARVWTTDELTALADGLEEYRGAQVFEKIFRRHCTRTGLLHDFTVTEIVTVAADLKTYLTQLQGDESGEVTPWVADIPVWTQGFSQGIENVDVPLTIDDNDDDHDDE